MAFARYKGEAEKTLPADGFPRVYIFRPAYIYAVEPRKEPNFNYRLLRAIYPVFRVLFPNLVIPADDLARAMIDVAVRETGETGGRVFENRSRCSPALCMPNVGQVAIYHRWAGTDLRLPSDFQKALDAPGHPQPVITVDGNRHTRKTGSKEETLVLSAVNSASLSLGSGADANSSARSKIRSSPGGTADVISWFSVNRSACRAVSRSSIGWYQHFGYLRSLSIMPAGHLPNARAFRAMRAIPFDFALARICGPNPPFSHALTFTGNRTLSSSSASISRRAAGA
jgi:hypothetical protein